MESGDTKEFQFKGNRKFARKVEEEPRGILKEKKSYEKALEAEKLQEEMDNLS